MTATKRSTVSAFGMKLFTRRSSSGSLAFVLSGMGMPLAIQRVRTETMRPPTAMAAIDFSVARVRKRRPSSGLRSQTMKAASTKPMATAHQTCPMKAFTWAPKLLSPLLCARFKRSRTVPRFFRIKTIIRRTEKITTAKRTASAA